MSRDDSPNAGTAQFDEGDFPELDYVDAEHLYRQYRMRGRDRVIGWLRAKTGLPIRLELAEDADEDAYYEAFADHLIQSGGWEEGADGD